MIRILQSLLALVSLLALAALAASASGASWQSADSAGQPAAAPPESAVRPCLPPGLHRLVPAQQPSSHLQGQPFAYGYFGAKALPSAAYHRGSTRDWFQWTIQRAN
jgi:hypothetical protein